MISDVKIRMVDESRGEREQTEDMLENIYAIWRSGQKVVMEDILREMTITKWEYKRFIKSLVKHGYIEPSKDMAEPSGEICLTAKGKELGAEIMKKHQYLKGFLKAICNVDEEIADHDACRIEHIISDEVLDGIRVFMKTGSVADRVVSGHDLSEFYSSGKYRFGMALYMANSVSPRILSPEFYYFGEDIEVLVDERENSIFYLKAPDMERHTGGSVSKTPNSKIQEEDIDVWYKVRDEWKKTMQGKNGFEIPGDAFVYTISGTISMMSGEGKIAFTEKDKVPQEEDIRRMDVHLW